MNQRFDGPVEQVAAGDIHNHVNPLGRLLTKGERIELNTLVQRLEDDFGEPRWKTWRFLHRTIGVDNIDAICIGHRDSAQELLNLLMRCGELQKSVDAQPILNLDSKADSLTTELESTEAALKKSKQELSRLSRRIISEEKRAQEANSELVAARGEIQRQELLLTKSHDQLAQLKLIAAEAHKRINRLKAISMLLAITVVGIFLSSAYHSESAKYVEASLIPQKKGTSR